MMDQGFLALAEAAMLWVDDRYGRGPAWIVGIGAVSMPIGLIALAAAWYAHP